MVNKYIENILARYFTGEATQQENIELEKWIAESKENEEYFDEMTFIYQQVACIEEYPQVNTEIAFGKFKEHITTDVVEKKKPKRSRPVRLLWQITALAAAILAIFLIVGNPLKEKENTFYAENDTLHMLPNGANVKVYKGGNIKYNKEFSNKTIELEGKADFEVNSEQMGSIIVKVHNVFIEDIGTMFTVDALSKDTISVMVTEGKVRFYTDKKSIMLEKGETAIYLESQQDFKMVVAEPVKIRRASFNFSGTTLKEAINEINSAYSSQISLNDAKLEDLQISVSFNNEEMETVLEIISSTLDLKLERENANYVISK